MSCSGAPRQRQRGGRHRHAHPGELRGDAAAGQARWLQPLTAGGCTVGETVVVLVMAQPLNQGGLDLAFVSPDINGDLTVNLADLSSFAAGYTGTYDACADMFYDSVINLSDLSLFSQAYGI